jgi:hypothetical protein
MGGWGNERWASKKNIGLFIGKKLVNSWGMDESSFLHKSKVQKVS